MLRPGCIYPSIWPWVSVGYCSACLVMRIWDGAKAWLRPPLPQSNLVEANLVSCCANATASLLHLYSHLHLLTCGWGGLGLTK